MNQTELEQLVAQIGEEIFARLEVPKAVKTNGRACSGCSQSPEACAATAKQLAASGAARLSDCEHWNRIDPEIARLIDHTLLRPEATRDQILQLCREARQYCFATVCVNPYWAPLAAAELAGSPVKVCTVVSFPFGATSTESKVAETAAALRVGAQEVDMVINIGALRSGDQETVKQDIRAVVETAHQAGAIVKVILETALLDDNQKAIACMLAKMGGADFVKTSTGFGPAGANVHDVALMRSVVGPDLGVKAAGGIRTLEDVKKLAAAGASRIGASASVKIVEASAASR